MASNKFSLAGRTALVTGGTRGCGLAFATGLAEAGADVAIFDILPASPEFNSLATRFNVRTAHYTVDVSSPPSLAAGFTDFAKDSGGRLDICVACAGIHMNVSFLEVNWEDHSNLLSVNVLGVYHTAQLAAKQMIANGTSHGSIILIGSIASDIAIRAQNVSAYCSTKGAVKSMVPAIAAEMVQYGIRVNSLSPGFVRTEMTAPFMEPIEEWNDRIMNGRVAEPDEIVGGCVFLAGDGSTYMTGQDLCVDGGVTKW